MKNYIIYTLVAFCLVAVSGCNKWLDINTNPNQLTVTKPDFILSGALVTTAVIKSGGDVNAYAGMWSGYTSASGSYSQSGDQVRTYIMIQSYGNTPWADLYSNLSNYQYVENHVSGSVDNSYYTAICEIMKAYDYQNLVDIFGDVPYSQALTGFQFLYPKYNTAAYIYGKLSDKLDSAVNLIKNAPSTANVLPATTDVMFAGNMVQWAKLANTLRLRILLHQSEVAGNGSYISGEITKINTNGYGFLGVGEDALINPGYTAAQNLQSPFWENYGASFSGVVGGRDYDRASAYGVSMLTTLDDPRINYIYRAPGDNPGTNSGSQPSDYVGIVFGGLPSTANNTGNTSGWGVGLLKNASQSCIFFSASQSLFLQSEAAFRGWISGSAQTFYNSAVAESFRLLSVPSASAAAATYTSSGVPDADYTVAGSAAAQLETIITQKWIANLMLDAIEAWDDSRRLTLPVGIPYSQDPTRVGNINPVRLLYPQTEYNNNNTNVTNEGSITPFTKIFWDVN